MWAAIALRLLQTLIVMAISICSVVNSAIEYMVSDTILFFENTGDKTVPVFESRTGSANPLDGLILNTIATAPVFCGYRR